QKKALARKQVLGQHPVPGFTERLAAEQSSRRRDQLANALFGRLFVRGHLAGETTRQRRKKPETNACSDMSHWRESFRGAGRTARGYFVSITVYGNASTAVFFDNWSVARTSI